jgi:hypothetical protein
LSRTGSVNSALILRDTSGTECLDTCTEPVQSSEVSIEQLHALLPQLAERVVMRLSDRWYATAYFYDDPVFF